MSCGNIFDLTNVKERLKIVENKLSKADFWKNNQNEATALSQERGASK